jgi:hypothetical protein
MPGVKPVCDESSALGNHHRQNVFAALIDSSYLVEFNDAILGGRMAPSDPPARNQFLNCIFREPALQNPSLLRREFFHGNS